jgi:hypothetical protein
VSPVILRDICLVVILTFLHLRRSRGLEIADAIEAGLACRGQLLIAAVKLKIVSRRMIAIVNISAGHRRQVISPTDDDDKDLAYDGLEERCEYVELDNVDERGANEDDDKGEDLLAGSQQLDGRNGENAVVTGLTVSNDFATQMRPSQPDLGLFLAEDTSLQIMLETKEVGKKEDTWARARDQLEKKTGISRTVAQVQSRSVALCLDGLVAEPCPEMRVTVRVGKRYFEEVAARADAVSLEMKAISAGQEKRHTRRMARDAVRSDAQRKERSISGGMWSQFDEELLVKTVWTVSGSTYGNDVPNVSDIDWTVVLSEFLRYSESERTVEGLRCKWRLTLPLNRKQRPPSFQKP